MFAILKNHRGQPECLFEIERETPKRIYGHVADTLQRDSWFWLTGLTRGPRIDGIRQQDYATKEIILCLIKSDNAWFQVKDTLLRIKSAHKEIANGIASDLNDAREVASTAEIENNADARKAYTRELEKYVCKADLL